MKFINNNNCFWYIIPYIKFNWNPLNNFRDEYGISEEELIATEAATRDCCLQHLTALTVRNSQSGSACSWSCPAQACNPVCCRMESLCPYSRAWSCSSSDAGQAVWRLWWSCNSPFMYHDVCPILPDHKAVWEWVLTIFQAASRDSHRLPPHPPGDPSVKSNLLYCTSYMEKNAEWWQPTHPLATEPVHLPSLYYYPCISSCLSNGNFYKFHCQDSTHICLPLS